MRGLPLLLLAAVAVPLAGCAREIDSAKAERSIARTVADQVGAEVRSVECPDGLTAEKGDTFECTVTGADGSSGTAQVTERDDRGTVSVSAPFIDVGELEQSIEEGIAKQVGDDVDVTCPELVAGAKGDTFDCTASSGPREVTVNVTQTDAQGRVRYELAK